MIKDHAAGYVTTPAFRIAIPDVIVLRNTIVCLYRM